MVRGWAVNFLSSDSASFRVKRHYLFFVEGSSFYLSKIEPTSKDNFDREQIVYNKQELL